jgi:hypothetical protein
MITCKQLEFSLSWCKNNPDLFAKSMVEWTQECVELGLTINQEPDMSRNGFMTITAKEYE